MPPNSITVSLMRYACEVKQVERGTISHRNGLRQAFSSHSVRYLASESTSRSSKYPLYPSVVHLLQQNGIPVSEAGKISATGPGGRLLKGDVLSYLGSLSVDYSSQQAKRIQKLGRLNLDVVKMQKSPPPAPSPTKESPQPVTVTTTVSLDPILQLQEKLSHSIGVRLPLPKLVARAAVLANQRLPATPQTRTSNELFDSIISKQQAIPQHQRGSFAPTMHSVTKSSPKSVPSIYDILTSKSPRKIAATERETPSDSHSPLRRLTVTTLPSHEAQARVFLERMKASMQTNPSTLVA